MLSLKTALTNVANSIKTLKTNITALSTWQTNWVNNGGTQIKLLWTNSNPSSNFAAKQISLNLSSYDAVLVETRYNTSSSARGKTSIIFINYDERIMQLMNVGTDSKWLFACERVCYPRSTYVGFEANYTKKSDNTAGALDNTHNIPTRIWGIKF